MERTATPARAKAAGNSQASPPTATAPVVDSTEFDAAIVEEAGKRWPAGDGVAYGVGDRRAFGHERQLPIEPQPQIVDNLFRSLPPRRQSKRWRLAADFLSIA